jgi:hypothetical protein
LIFKSFDADLKDPYLIIKHENYFMENVNNIKNFSGTTFRGKTKNSLEISRKLTFADLRSC